MLIIVMNNGWGISTSASSQHAETHIIDRGQAFGIPGEVVDGNDVVASWYAIRRALEYSRRERRPYMLEAMVSRLYGHSSSTGCQRVKTEADCIELLERKLIHAEILTREAVDRVHQEALAEVEQAAEEALHEARPEPEDIPRFTYAPSSVDAVYPDDYTELP